MNIAEGLKTWAGARQLGLDDWKISDLLRFASMLSEYKLANVVGTRDYEVLVQDHILDSLSCLLFAPLSQAGSLVDIGSGGGLPGIPLKLARPEIPTTLVESTGKKARFMQNVIEQLSLREVAVANARAEELARRSEYRERYEVATARAVASLATVAEYCAPFIRVGGFVVAMKGRLAHEEGASGEEAARELGMELEEILPVVVEKERERNLVVFKKRERTPDKFPRKPGVAKKSPLGRGRPSTG